MWVPGERRTGRYRGPPGRMPRPLGAVEGPRSTQNDVGEIRRFAAVQRLLEASISCNVYPADGVLQNAFGVRPALVGIPGFVSVVDLRGCGDEPVRRAHRCAQCETSRDSIAGGGCGYFTPGRRCEWWGAHDFLLKYRCSRAIAQATRGLQLPSVFSSRLSILIVTSNSSGLTVLPHQRAYSQTEGAGGLTWVRADEMVPLAATWRNLIRRFSQDVPGG